MTFAVIIPSLRRTDELEKTLRNVLECRPLPNEITVVDGDPEGSARLAIDSLAAGSVPIRHLPAPTGLTVQRNHGLAATNSDIVVFIDDDVELDSETFAKLNRVFADTAVVGATGRVQEAEGRRVGGMNSPVRKLLPGRQGSFTSYGYPHRIVDVDRRMDVELMYGCFMAARTDAARTVLFDEQLPGYGLAEDEDFSYRLARAGRIVYEPAIRILHHNLGFRKMDRRAFGRSVVINRHYLFKKNFPQTLGSRMGFGFLICLLVVHRLLNRDLAGVRGISDGIREIRGAHR